MMIKKMLFTALVISALVTSCDKDSEYNPISKEFTVTIENVFTEKMYFNSGTTGLIKPGENESFSFDAGKGHYLQFSTMFVQSNDLFYAADDSGIPLYDANGNALTGDITSMIDLWDAGTEVNEEPGTGVNQAPRQSGPNTGAIENGMVKKISDVVDGFTYPDDASVIEVTLAHDGGTKFTVTITNISNTSTLGTPLAPGAWVVHSSGQYPIFEAGKAASANLEALAEDGNNAGLDTDLKANSGYVSPFAPGAYSIGSVNELFNVGQTAMSGLEALSEDGNPTGFVNIFNTPVGSTSATPILPSQSFSYTFTASETDKLSFASMLGQSNDWFIGVDAIKLFENGVAISGDITNKVMLFDAGTEVDQYAGAGNDQAPRQTEANTGEAENAVVAIETSAGDHVPGVSSMVKVTISSN